MAIPALVPAGIARLLSCGDSWHAWNMELLNMIDTIQPLERQYFLRCYCENMDAVVDMRKRVGTN